MSAGSPARMARTKGTSAVVASARRERETRGSTWWESPTVSPCPGKCLPQASTPAPRRPRASASAMRATRRGSRPKARSPITRLRGFDQTSSTGAKSRSMPTAASSRPIARPTASAACGSSVAPMTAAGGKWVNGRGRRWTRPPSWSMAISGGTPAPPSWSAATSARSCAAERTLRRKRMTPPGGCSAKKARVRRSTVGPGRPTMKSWETVRRSTAVGIGGRRIARPRWTRYIAVEGPIGVGKTALARRLATELGVPLILEQGEDNPFLRRFYEDRGKYAFQAQLFFLLERYRQQRELARHGTCSGGAVADYLFAKDRIFAAVNLNADELALYEQLYR